jgi:hypothetical protein
MIIAPIAGTLADKIGERPLMVTGLLVQSAGLAWVALIADPGMAYSSLVPPMIVAGVGVSMAIPSAQNSVVGHLPLESLGKAAGTNSMMRDPGGLRYVTFKLEDGVSFAHIAETEDGANPLPKVKAFKEFLEDIGARCDEPPVTIELEPVGSYRV